MGACQKAGQRHILSANFNRTTLCSIDDMKRNNEISIWTQFINESLLQGILHTLAPETWQLEERRFFRPTMKMIYMIMAIYVRVQGICHRNQRPLREAIEEARRHFTDAHPHTHICRYCVDNLRAHFLIDHTSFECLSENFNAL